MATSLPDNGHPTISTRTEAVRELRGAIARGDHWIVVGGVEQGDALDAVARIPGTTVMLDNDEGPDPLNPQPPAVGRFGASTSSVSRRAMLMGQYSHPEQRWIAAVPRDSSVSADELAERVGSAVRGDTVFLVEDAGHLGNALAGKQ